MAASTTGQGSIYDEVYLAMRPLTNIMSLYGLFPILKNSSEDEKIQSVVDKMKFRWGSKLMIYTLLTFAGTVSFCVALIWDYTPRIPDPLERIIVTFIVIILSLAGFLNQCTMVVQISKWQSYFKQWQQVDSLLDISLDNTLRSFVKTASIAYLIYLAAAVCSVIYAAILKYFGSNEDDYTGDGFIIGLFFYSVFINGSQLLPEILFICLSVALKIRVAILIERIRENVTMQAKRLKKCPTNEKTDIASDLQQFRLSYHCITEVLQGTNAFMGPVLCVCVMFTTAYLSSTIFMVFFQSLDNKGFVSIKIVFSSCCILRLTSICLFADQIKRKMSELKRAIYLIPTIQLQLSQESVDELAFLVGYAKKSNFSFTGNDFFAIDKELLNKMGGAILTYTLTILEFSQKQ